MGFLSAKVLWHNGLIGRGLYLGGLYSDGLIDGGLIFGEGRGGGAYIREEGAYNRRFTLAKIPKNTKKS